MKTFSPKQLSIYISLLTSIVSGVIFGLSVFINDSSFWLFLIILILSIFIIVYITVYSIINKFIVEKIKPIYKTIQNANIPNGELNENIEDKDIISVVKEEAEDWVKNKTQEIKKLKETEKYRKEFLGNISHELKTPVFNIQGYILTLLDGGLDDKTINSKYLQRAEKSIERLISIINDLEAISKLESGELELKYEDFDIVKLIEDVIETHEMLTKQKNITLSIINSSEKTILVKADKQQIYQVVSNLIVNTIKYGKENGETKIEFFDMDNSFLIEISDNGIGIPENAIPRLFERFYRVDQSRSREQGGTGLGLAIVKHIIEAHNQTINVRSKLNEGSAFSFTLKKA